MDTHTHAAVSTHARHSTGIRTLPRCCFSLSLLCPPTGHDPRHLFVSAPTVRSLGNNYGPHLMTSGMPRAVVVVSSVIPLYFGLLSRNYCNPRVTIANHGYTTRGSGLTNYIPVHACTHTYVMRFDCHASSRFYTDDPDVPHHGDSISTLLASRLTPVCRARFTPAHDT